MRAVRSTGRIAKGEDYVVFFVQITSLGARMFLSVRFGTLFRFDLTANARSRTFIARGAVRLACCVWLGLAVFDAYGYKNTGLRV